MSESQPLLPCVDTTVTNHPGPKTWRKKTAELLEDRRLHTFIIILVRPDASRGMSIAQNSL